MLVQLPPMLATVIEHQLGESRDIRSDTVGLTVYLVGTMAQREFCLIAVTTAETS